MGPGERAERTKSDLVALRETKFTPKGPITLDQAIARAIAYNLEGRVKEIEHEIADAELETRNYDMLPELSVEGRRDWLSEPRTTTDDPVKNSANATITWNILDLGVSYAKAKQQANKVLIAREQERKALQDIVRKVRVAYRRAAGARQLMNSVNAISRSIKGAMQESRAMERSGANAVAESVSYRRGIIEAVRQALSVQRELRESRAQLAELLNIPPGTPFTLEAEPLSVAMPVVPMSLPEMERYALDNRPELRVEDYKERVSDWQAREAMFSMLPAPKVSLGKNYSNDSYDLTPNWLSTGFQLGMNIFNLFSGASRIDEAEKRGELARRQRLAMTVAVLSQTRIAYIDFRNATQHMRLAREVARADQRLATLVASDAEYVNTNYFEAVQYATRTLRSEIEEHQAEVDLVKAQSELIHAIGLDAFPENIRLDDLDKLTQQVHAVTARWQTKGDEIDAPADTPLDALVNSMLKGGEKDPSIRGKPPRHIDIRELAPDEPAGEDTSPERTRPIELPANALRTAAGPAAAPPTGPDSTAKTARTDETVVLTGLTQAGFPPIGVTDTTKDAAGNRPVHVAQFGVFRSDKRAARLRRNLTKREDAPLHGVDVRIVRRSGPAGEVLNYVETPAIPDPLIAHELCKTLHSLGRDCIAVERSP